MKSSTPSRRAWRRERSKAMATVLQGMAALEGVTLPKTLDVGYLRQRLLVSTSPRLLSSDINVALSRAAREFEAANPKPR
jgi:hypothetical protein